MNRIWIWYVFLSVQVHILHDTNCTVIFFLQSWNGYWVSYFDYSFWFVSIEFLLILHMKILVDNIFFWLRWFLLLVLKSCGFLWKYWSPSFFFLFFIVSASAELIAYHKWIQILNNLRVSFEFIWKDSVWEIGSLLRSQMGLDTIPAGLQAEFEGLEIRASSLFCWWFFLWWLVFFFVVTVSWALSQTDPFWLWAELKMTTKSWWFNFKPSDDFWEALSICTIEKHKGRAGSSLALCGEYIWFFLGGFLISKSLVSLGHLPRKIEILGFTGWGL